MDPFGITRKSADRSLASPSVKIEADSRAIVNGPRSVQKHASFRDAPLGVDNSGAIDGKAVSKAVFKAVSAQPRPAAALALDHFVALLQQALALAVLALLLLLDVGAFFIGHNDLQTMLSREPLERLPGERTGMA
jgi:hypothetical protein